MKQKFGKPWFRGSRKKCFLCIVVTFVIICVNIQWQIVEKWREKRMQEGRGLIGKLFKKWINVIYRAVACLGGGALRHTPPF